MAENANPVEQPQALPTAEALAEMSPEVLQETLDAAHAEAQTIRETDVAEMTDAQVDRLEALADLNDAIAAEDTRREQAAAERAERVANATSRLEPAAEGEQPAEPETPAEDTPAEGDEPTETDTPAEVEQPQAMAAGATRRPAPRPRQRNIPRPAEQRDSGNRYSLVAASDVPGIASGTVLDGMAGLADAFQRRSQGFPEGPARAANIRHQHQVASIRRNHDQDRDGLYSWNPEYAGADGGQRLFAAAADESRLSSGSLVAAGGWCAPSETMYGLTGNETLDSIIDLPTVGVTRGGINYTPGPDFADIFTSAGFSQTEAQAIAGTTKPCVEVDCPDFTEVRLDAVGFCVKAPLLTRTAYPEVIQRWMDGTVVANQHKVAARLIQAMRNSLTAVAPTLTGTPLTWGLLTALELVIEGQRQAWRLGANQTLEVVAPRWLRVAIRADLANRAFTGPASVSDAQIAEHFADRGARVQWVLNYQELATPKAPLGFPSTVEVMAYPAGTFVKGEADVVNLDTIYDTADLQTNVYTAAFVEDGVLLAKMQHGGAKITVPCNVNGMMAALQIDDNWGGAQQENAGAAAA